MVPFNFFLLVCIIYKTIHELDAKFYTHEDFKSRCKDPSSWIGGCVPSSFCAFRKDGALNTMIIPDYAKFLAKQNIKTVIVNHPGYGCDTLTAKEKNTNLYHWIRACKRNKLNTIAYVSGYSGREVASESSHARQLGAVAVMVRPDIYYRYNSTFLRVAFLEELARAAYPAPVLYDNEITRLEGSEGNPIKFHSEATKQIPNYIGIRLSVPDAMDVISVTELTGCQVLLTYDSTSWAPTNGNISVLMSSYTCSIYPEEVVQIHNLLGNKSADESIGRFLKLAKKFGVARRYVNSDNISGSVYPYVEVVMRALFVCVSGLDVGESRHYAVYTFLTGLRENFKTCMK